MGPGAIGPVKGRGAWGVWVGVGVGGWWQGAYGMGVGGWGGAGAIFVGADKPPAWAGEPWGQEPWVHEGHGRGGRVREG